MAIASTSHALAVVLRRSTSFNYRPRASRRGTVARSDWLQRRVVASASTPQRQQKREQDFGRSSAGGTVADGIRAAGRGSGSGSTNSADSLWELVEYGSSIITLYPGDVINNGTSGGTAAGSASTRGEEDRYLKPGEVVEASIDGIGTLRLPVVAGEQPPGETGARLPPVNTYRD